MKSFLFLCLLWSISPSLIAGEKILSWRNSNDNQARMWDVPALKVYEDKSFDTSKLVIGKSYFVKWEELSESSFVDPVNENDFPLTLAKFSLVSEVVQAVATIQKFDGKAYTVLTTDGKTLKLKSALSGSKKLPIDTSKLPSATPYALQFSEAGIHSAAIFNDLVCEGQGLNVKFSTNSNGHLSSAVRISGMEFNVGHDEDCGVKGEDLHCEFVQLSGIAYGQLTLPKTDAKSYSSELVFADPTAEPFPLSCKVLSVEDILKKK